MFTCIAQCNSLQTPTCNSMCNAWKTGCQAAQTKPDWNQLADPDNQQTIIIITVIIITIIIMTIIAVIYTLFFSFLFFFFERERESHFSVNVVSWFSRSTNRSTKVAQFSSVWKMVSRCSGKPIIMRSNPFPRRCWSDAVPDGLNWLTVFRGQVRGEGRRVVSRGHHLHPAVWIPALRQVGHALQVQGHCVHRDHIYN